MPFLLFAWLFEFTPEGLKWKKDVDRNVAGVEASGPIQDILEDCVLFRDGFE